MHRRYVVITVSITEHTKKEYLAFVYVKTIIYFDDGFLHCRLYPDDPKIQIV